MNILTEMILIKNSKTKEFEDKTVEVKILDDIGNQVVVTYLSTNKTYNYNASNIKVFKNPKVINTEEIIVCIDRFPITDPTFYT